MTHEDSGVVIQRRHSTTDLFALRRWEYRNEQQGEHGPITCEEEDATKRKVRRKCVGGCMVMPEEEALRLLGVVAVATARRSLPLFQRGEPVMLQVNAQSFITTVVFVIIWVDYILFIERINTAISTKCLSK